MGQYFTLDLIIIKPSNNYGELTSTDSNTAK